YFLIYDKDRKAKKSGAEKWSIRILCAAPPSDVFLPFHFCLSSLNLDQTAHTIIMIDRKPDFYRTSRRVLPRNKSYRPRVRAGRPFVCLRPALTFKPIVVKLHPFLC